MPTEASPVRRKLPKPAEKPSKANKPNDGKAVNAPSSPEKEASAKLEQTAFEKKIGFSAESMKALFTSEKPSDKIKKLKDLLRSRCVDGRTQSLNEWRVKAAEDEAYNAPFRQITPTLIGKITSGDQRLKPEEVLKELERWNLPESSLFTVIRNPDGTFKERALIKDTFTTVKVPIVKSMLNAREAKLFAERDNEPFMSFEPTRSTEEWQVVGEIITKIVSQISAGCGWKSTYRGLNHNALKYSHAFMFPVESWYVEKDIDEKGEEYISKEGIRYNIPPKTRVAWDQTHRPATFLTDTGCKWALYWRLVRFSDVDLNPAYYNKDKISYSGTNWVAEGSAYETYFRYVYPCTVSMPILPKTETTTKDREQNATYYTTGDHDKAIFQTDLFCKLSPKQWGISDYEPEVWIRFVMASDGDVCYADPFPYCPPLYLGTDADDANATMTASFALEIIPWQDLIGNVLSDILMAMKQNSVKVILYDKYQMTEDKIQEMMARARESGSACWFPMDWKDLQRGQVNVDLLFKAFSFPMQNIGEKIQTLNTLFNVMERGLGVSAQETGSIAGHTQTKTEVDIISSNVGTRLGLLTSMADDLFDAWKRQVMKGIMWFMDEDFAVDVSAISPELVAKMKKDFGFEFESIGKDKMRVTGKKSKLSVDTFLSTREGRTRQSNPQTAQVMFQGIAAMAANPELAARLGPEQMIKMWNRALTMAGIPEDTKWKLDAESTTAMENKKVMETIQQFAKEIASQIEASATKAATDAATQQALTAVGKEVAPALKQVNDEAQQAQAGVQAVAQQSQQADQQIVSAMQQQKVEMDKLGKALFQINEFLQRMVPPQAAPLAGTEPGF